jgi:hypothetical protein
VGSIVADKSVVIVSKPNKPLLILTHSHDIGQELIQGIGNGFDGDFLTLSLQRTKYQAEKNKNLSVVYLMVKSHDL